MNGADWNDKRLMIGLLALGCLVGAAGIWLFTDQPETNQFLSALTRVGIALGAVWLALPKTGESIVWQKIGPAIVVTIAVLALARRMAVYLLPVALVVLLAALFLRPKPKRPR